MSFRAAGGWITALFLVLSCFRAQAATAEPLSSEEKTTINFAFATQLGSGIYSIGGRTIQVYRFPLAWTLLTESPERVGLKITFPLTFGFYDFKAADVLDTGVPKHLDTVSLVPGLEFRLMAAENWLVKPYFEAGIA